MATVGRAEVKIVADARGFSRDAERAVNRELRRVDVDSSPIANGVADGLQNRVVRNAVEGSARGAGRSWIQQFGIVLQGGISPRAAGGIGAVVLAALGPVMLTVGTLVGGLLITGLGAGLVGLGAFFAAQQGQVRNEFAGVFRDIGNDMRVISRPLIDPLLQAAETILEAFAPFRVAFREAFEDVAPGLEIFIRDMGRAFEALAPAIGPVTDAFIEIMEELGPELANDVFPDLAEAIINLADAIGENAGTFVDILTWFLSIPEAIINFLAELTRLAGWFADNPGAIIAAFLAIGAVLGFLVAGPIGALVGALIGVGIAIINLREQVGVALDAIGKFFADTWASISENVGTAVDDIKQMWENLKTNTREGWNAITSKVGNSIESIKGFFRGVGRTAMNVWDRIERGGESVIRFFRGLPGRISGAVGGAFDGLWGAFRSAINNIISGWNRLSFSLPSVDTRIPGVGTIGGWTLHTPNIPFLQSGGLIERAGMARVGEAGPETVFLPQGAVVDPRPVDQIVAQSERLPDEFEATATIDLGNDIQRAVNLTFRRVATNARAGQRRTAATA